MYKASQIVYFAEGRLTFCVKNYNYSMNYKNIHDRFWDQGFVILEGFFEDEMMDNYNRKILQHFEVNRQWAHDEEFIAKSSAELIPWFPDNDGDGGFDGIDQPPAFNRTTDAILTDGWQNLYCMMMFSEAGSQGQAWHQDCPPDNRLTFNLNRLVYTHNITEETGGAIVIMSEAHKAGLLPVGKSQEELEGQVVFQPKKGTVIFLHGHCFHRVLPVMADRISTNFRAVPEDTPEDITDICVYRNTKY